MKRLLFLLAMATFLFYDFSLQAQTKTKQEIKAERKAHRQAMRAHNKMVRQLQNEIAYQNALQALKNNSWALQANTLYNNYGMPMSVTNNTNFIAMDRNRVSLQLAFNGFNPGPNGLGGITVTGWPSSIHQRIDKKGNVTYTFNVMGAAIFAQVTVQLSYGSNYATATVTGNTNGRQLTFSGILLPYSQSNIFESGFSF
ncbi:MULTISPECIES: DUF4251 domain-containing protein [Porphyromonadaceae]|uniref:Uncharacterized protein n=1 Tax=Sanguibacteroides justesenii TaxID=1547597 RepID=A0A0C3RD25_9PORP|nr:MULTISPECIES: DUF4251 domain-containing protein [Porphyromonadaceae]KIO44056.1 hypothetical protein BA92_11795 [Sanguibacteroides justesenii]KIO47284.1 hypothetical protein IE90_01455 [Sanguibacteroides justesenii]MCR9012686.1 DUF4251 domain-containing protein [Gabonibacter chumensis]PXZ43910.1 DUF4251 domain-containing protein [Sanguibacteroides justesenii]